MVTQALHACERATQELESVDKVHRCSVVLGAIRQDRNQHQYDRKRVVTRKNTSAMPGVNTKDTRLVIPSAT